MVCSLGHQREYILGPLHRVMDSSRLLSSIWPYHQMGHGTHFANNLYNCFLNSSWELQIGVLFLALEECVVTWSKSAQQSTCILKQNMIKWMSCGTTILETRGKMLVPTCMLLQQNCVHRHSDQTCSIFFNPNPSKFAREVCSSILPYLSQMKYSLTLVTGANPDVCI